MMDSYGNIVGYVYESSSSSAAVDDVSPSSLLSQDIQQVLEAGMKDGFNQNTLNLSWKGVNDRMIPELCGWIIKLGDKVRSINLSNTAITSEGVSTLFNALRRSNLKVIDIDLSGNTIDDFCMRSLGEYVQSNTCIEFMNFKKTCITDAGIEVLAHSLIGNSTFKKIDISQNKSISNKSLPMLLELTKSSHILDINIDHTSIAERNSLVIFLAENSIKYKSNKLHFNSKNLDKYGIRDICEFMKIYGIDNLQDINLMKNKIVSEGAGILFETLKECNSVITSLDLTENHINHTCLKKLGEYVQDNEHLEVLYLTKNYISDTGIEVLSEYLVGNTTMVYFSVGSNKDITDDSVPYLEEIARKTHILDFDLSLTSITAGKKKALKELLKIPVEKREIPVRSNTKSAAKRLSSSA